jgi:hypothetical protein
LVPERFNWGRRNEKRAHDSGRQLRSVLDALKQLSGTDVLVGIPAGPPRDDAPLSNAELGYLQSTGATVEIDGETVTLPPRPFLDMGIEDSRDKTTERLKLAAQAALEGNADVARCILKPQDRLPAMRQRRLLAGDRLTHYLKRIKAQRNETGQAISRLCPWIPFAERFTTS